MGTPEESRKDKFKYYEDWAREQDQYYTVQTQPITVAIPYNYRWRVLQAKLMLSDLEELCKKHNIPEACELYETVKTEIALLLKKLKSLIESKREMVEAVAE
jgi:dTDP-4-amino-4,6-dideoxygalactose transaminase